MELIIVVGLQAAGKSTFYATHFATTHELVSKDLLRNNRNKERRQAQLIEAALRAGRSVIVDNTNATAAVRAPLIALGHAYGARVVGYYFPPDVRASRERNSQRAGRERVPDVAIYATAKKLQPPRYAEGFDALFDVRIAENGQFEVRERSSDEEVPTRGSPNVGDEVPYGTAGAASSTTACSGFGR
ncbi:MAG TPA: ATP-binding protein [Ktedonobacterales bacterium]|nr:ATP-binding protein [Ktedonobacterales bacterium]